MILTEMPATIFANAVAAEAFAVNVVDADAGEYFEITFNPAGDGRCIVTFYEADGYKIATA